MHSAVADLVRFARTLAALRTAASNKPLAQLAFFFVTLAVLATSAGSRSLAYFTGCRLTQQPCSQRGTWLASLGSYPASAPGE